MKETDLFEDENVPQSIGIIMDGNRRFAKEIMKRPWEGHKFGVKKAREVLLWSDEFNIKYLTCYALSIENINSRPKKELEKIFDYFEKEMDVILSGNHIVHDTETKVNFIGRLNLIPEKLLKKIERVEEKTENYNKHFMNIAIAYGGQQEIVDAVKKISSKISNGEINKSEIDESLIKKNLYTNDFRYPDLIIRTGGERRLSNFLLWQSAYAELSFTDRKWPELSREDFVEIIKDYQIRERRFGK